MYTVVFNGEEWLFDTIGRARTVAKLLDKRGHTYVRVYKYPTKELMYLANKKDKKTVVINYNNKEVEKFEEIVVSDAAAYKSEPAISRLSLLSKPKKKVKRLADEHEKILRLLERRGQLSLDLFPRR